MVGSWFCGRAWEPGDILLYESWDRRILYELVQYCGCDPCIVLLYPHRVVHRVIRANVRNRRIWSVDDDIMVSLHM